MRYFDLYHGTELTPRATGEQCDPRPSHIEARGYGAVLAIEDEPGCRSHALMIADEGDDGASRWPAIRMSGMICRRQLVEIKPTKPAATAPEGMVRIPGGDFDFKVEGIEIEGYNDVGVDVQYPWETMRGASTSIAMTIKPFYMDKYPVTNAQFKKFLDATHYHPADDLNFLKDWKNGNLSARLGQQAGDLGLAGRCPRLCRLGGQAAAA